MRAEELIMRIWTQRQQLLTDGRRPKRIVISRSDYETIQDYHRGLGFLPDGVEDYISRYTLFDLPFFLSEDREYRVSIEDDGRLNTGG